jgi:hypothetical protein
MTVYIHILDQAAANTAMRSGVTEVAFFNYLIRPDEAAKKAQAESSAEELKQVETIGKGTGSTIGWGEFFLRIPLALSPAFPYSLFPSSYFRSFLSTFFLFWREN